MTSTFKNPVINSAALEPLYGPHEEPCRYRAPAEREGEAAQIVQGRRPSNIPIAQNLRASVKEWRENDYIGASDTTRELLHYWFDQDHLRDNKDGERVPFRYFFCQREAIETLIYLYEIRGIRSLSNLTAEFLEGDSYSVALGVNPKDDRWPKYAFKMATGSGKTKVMSLAVVWSYFHALREENSTLSEDFLIIAPNITVFERLKEDFANGKIFDSDPLIPTAWRGDWNLSVVLQDEASGAAAGGRLYLTNIHRLYDLGKRRKGKETEIQEWFGPAVSRAKALDTGEALRERVTSHRRIMVLNDEAHHLWDPDSAWNEAIDYVNQTISERTGGGIVSQLDFSATPKDNLGHIFQHVICDTPLGEAVDAGVVKIPIIGHADLVESPSDDAADRFQQHLMIGYERWKISKEEWQGSGKKALMFVMTENTESADQIARCLNSDHLFKELNGKTINLHTRLKGKIKWMGGKKSGYPVFQENEKDISEEDLKELRQLSRELDLGSSPFQCIVSVLMLREGWDVRNVTTIIPLRPFTARANILPEQTLGRGLRRMTYPGGPAEILTVVEHPAFVALYQEQLGEEGVYPVVVDANKVPKTTVTIFPDGVHKDLPKLDMVIPSVTPAYTRTANLEILTIPEIKDRFSKFGPLKLGEAFSEEIQYEGRHLLTNEVVELMMIKLPLLENGIGAISFYREELEHITGLRSLHSALAPMLETFLTEMLFGEKVTLFDPRLLSRLADRDVRERIRAVFVPLILSKTTVKMDQKAQGPAVSVVTWKPFQVTHSVRQPATEAERTAFNLVACSNNFEADMARFLDRAPEVAAFCKNAGPQALRIDYQTHTRRLALYTPDFLVRLTDGCYLMVETKGRVDIDVPLKMRAAIAWCDAASQSGLKWNYLYVPQEIFAQISDNRLEVLSRTCEPIVQNLLNEQIELPLTLETTSTEKAFIEEFIATEKFAILPSQYRERIEEAIALLSFMEKRESTSFAPIFVPLLGPLDEAAKSIIKNNLLDSIPQESLSQQKFFEPDLSVLPRGSEGFHKRQGSNLRRTLMENDGIMPIGLLKWCLEYARSPKVAPGGVFLAIKNQFSELVKGDLAEILDNIYDFRNQYIAHQEKELSNADTARNALIGWIDGLSMLCSLAQS